MPPATTTKAENVEFVGHIDGAIYAVAVQGDYAYIGEEPRLTVLDVSNPVSSTVVGKTPLFPGFVRSVTVAGTTAYVADGDGGCGLGPSLEVLFQPAAKVLAGTEDTCDHAAIDSKWIVDCTV